MVTYTGRLEVLSRFMPDKQKVKDVVEANKDVFSLTDEKLFGESFYAALHCRDKGFKYLREARQELGFHPPGTKCFKPNPRVGTSGAQPAATVTAAAPQPWAHTSQPLRGGPPPAAKRSGRGGKAERYVYFTNGTGAATNLREFQALQLIVLAAFGVVD